jgi:pilus assembly protein CpaB
MRRRFILILLCASVIGFLASYLVYQVVSQAALTRSDQSEQIVVAAVDLGLADTVTGQHIKLVNWPKASVPPGALRTAAEAEGRVVRSSVVAGEPLIDGKLAPQLSGRGGIMPMLIPEGQRGVTIRVDEAMRESGFVLPNSRVDVLVSMPKAGSNEKIAKVILQDVTVLASGQTVEMKDNKPVTNTTVTLALTPQQVERLAVAQSEGRLMLVQRNLRDTTFVRTPGATPSSLLSDVASATPKPDAKPSALARSAPLPVPVVEKYPVAVIRGTKVTEQTFVRDRGNSWAEQPGLKQ